MTAISITVVVPVYNSMKTIEELVTRMSRELQRYGRYEFILVNDGSKDQSYDICRRMAGSDPRVKFISFYRNYGQLSAILAGLREATGDIIVVMDDDLQNPPEEVHKLIAAIEQGYDFVFGKPIGRAEQSLFRRMGSHVNRLMAEYVFQKPKHIVASSYYALTRGLASEIVKYDGPYPYISGFIFRTSHNGCNVEVEHKLRAHGKSGYNYRRLIRMWLIGFTNFSVLPLRLATAMGFAAALGGFMLLFFILFRKIFAPVHVAAGWSSLMGGLLFWSGVQLLALGMLGEYVGRIFLLLNKAPQYAIKEKHNCSAPVAGPGNLERATGTTLPARVDTKGLSRWAAPGVPPRRARPRRQPETSGME